MASDYRLQFTSNQESPLFTGCQIKLEVRMINSDGNVIKSGPLSSAKIELLVLRDDFACDVVGNCTAEQLEEKEVKTRDGHISVLKGVVARRLVEGTCSFPGIQFREGSLRRTFTIAARVNRNEATGGHRVQEAFMGPVVVQTNRNKRIKEDHKDWKTIIEHARECDLKENHYLKAYKIVEFNGKYTAKENFNRYQKAIVDSQRKEAYNALESIPFDYIMNENGAPTKISPNRNVSEDLSLSMQDAAPPPNPSNHNAAYQVNNFIPGLTHVSQTCPSLENCNTAARIPVPGGGGSNPLLADSENDLSVFMGNHMYQCKKQNNHQILLITMQRTFKVTECFIVSFLFIIYVLQ
uniref:Calmodulin binding protein-like N-terminal domain-containing protein n=1 Tax=Oryza nivara TaxID=4536 RepID=A0A0E0J586_ORYNI